MFGSKLRSWVEAVRPRKKQHRKDKQSKNNSNTIGSNQVSTTYTPTSNNKKVQQSEGSSTEAGGGKRANISQTNHAPTISRYSANNLSSPESAYSTGYSTDGTSPGAPPEYYINIRTGETNIHPNEQQLGYLQHRGIRGETEINPSFKKQQTLCSSPKVPTVRMFQADRKPSSPSPTNMLQEKDRALTTQRSAFNNTITTQQVLASPVLTSPRQRNRIRTNPWLPGSSTLSPAQIRQDFSKLTHTPPVNGSPISCRFSNPSIRKGPMLRNRSLSSSSCSSLSGSFHWDQKKTTGSGSEDDCTLNEMMGKYDESYIYEKETDILSDSDPTDCETDIDTGQDGGDEDDPLEVEFDFIDNGSYLEFDLKEDRNTGHCTYYNFDLQKRTSRRRMTRRSKQFSEKRRRSSSNKKRHKQQSDKQFQPHTGSKSAGATPLSVRRTKQNPISKLDLEDCLKRRSNSISFSRNTITTTIDKRDKEADRKYKELIVEAEQILRNMKTNCLSPRRVPGPANKRVEMLRSTECSKPDFFVKNHRITDESQFSRIPSTNFNCPRFSPKKNHITNFMINNSSVLWRENELPVSPLAVPKKPESPLINKVHRNERHSPKYRKKMVKVKKQDSSSSDSEADIRKDFQYVNNRNIYNVCCPQSEPVRRKVYGTHNKTVAFNLNSDVICNTASPLLSPKRQDPQKYKNSAENLRHQVLLNTIVNLKRSLEDQSASLKQVYRSSQNIHS